MRSYDIPQLFMKYLVQIKDLVHHMISQMSGTIKQNCQERICQFLSQFLCRNDQSKRKTIRAFCFCNFLQEVIIGPGKLHLKFQFHKSRNILRGICSKLQDISKEFKSV